MKRTIMVALGCVSVLLAPASALAGRGDSVDPGIMQPALNPAFGPWECWRTGAGITCDGESHDSWTNAETFIVCDGRPVYSTGTDDRTLERHGDQHGLALWSRSQGDVPETFSMQPDGSGPTLRATGSFEIHYDYGVPGDGSTRTARWTGIDLKVVGRGVGLVLHDVGVKTFDIDGEVIFRHGPHPVVDDFDGAFQKVCDAFEALGA
ncbi:MAG: hypothetical protein ACJ777_02710 [Chloroflexota bacterium]